MWELVVEAAKWLFAKFDPWMVAVLFALAYSIYDTRKLIVQHIESIIPHTKCAVHETLVDELKTQLEKQHMESREDIKTLTKSMNEDFRALSASILELARNGTANHRDSRENQGEVRSSDKRICGAVET